MVKYTYDAWGNPITATGNTAISTLNPLRYRGYVYDTETCLYYLQSRYYDPETGRFINADSMVSTGQGILGNNMFAYCGNNPVMRVDPNGEGWKKFIVAIVVLTILTINFTTSSYNVEAQKKQAEDRIKLRINVYGGQKGICSAKRA